MTKERQEALDHFNRFLDLIDLYEAQAANVIEDGLEPFGLVELAARHDAEIGHALLLALPNTELDLPLMIRVLHHLSQAYTTTMKQIITEARQRVKEEEKDVREN